MREPFKKHVPSLPALEAHGIGKRTVVLSSEDSISENLQAMTFGVIRPKTILPDFFRHEDKDEIISVVEGNGVVHFKDRQPMPIGTGDVVCIPAGTFHRLENPTDLPLSAFFIRVYARKG